jgi:DeoR/GlpR family transcriptional regulator of sugar metabolism
LIVYERLSDKFGMNTFPSLSGIERQNHILQRIASNQRITTSDICETFKVSGATARRDLERLAAQGKLQRVHGGAIPLQHAPPELPMLQRQDEQADEKKRIGQAAAVLIREDETVFLGSGTTVLEVARALRGRRLTVITNSLPVVNALAGAAEITLVCLGGMLRESEFSFIGHLTEQVLKEVRADKVFLGAHAISTEQGLTNDYLPETLTDRAILKAGREAILVADHTKFGRVATARLAPLESIQTIVTDAQTSAEFASQAAALGIKFLAV